jgi:catechol 2,3-dioxygenase-like lactoylglutathione lyase family enzyme
MQAYVVPTEQLVVEVFVRDLATSRDFYQALGFELLEDRRDFAILGWEGHQLFLDERPDLPASPHPRANVRVMVKDVEAHWKRAKGIGATIAQELNDRDYGLRDFTITDPDGFGVRFASRLTPA